MTELIIGQINIRSITAHFTEYKEHILLSNYDIICCTETWLNDFILDDTIMLQGFNLFGIIGRDVVVESQFMSSVICRYMF